MPDYTIYLIGGQEEEAGRLSATTIDGRCRIVFQYRNSVIEEESCDYFEAFCRVRSRLEKEHLIPFCYGASLNVHPSGMSRSMGDGTRAYRLTLGRQARTADLVHIFEEGHDVIPAQVLKQREYFDNWLKSLKA